MKNDPIMVEGVLFTFSLYAAVILIAFDPFGLIKTFTHELFAWGVVIVGYVAWAIYGGRRSDNAKKNKD